MITRKKEIVTRLPLNTKGPVAASRRRSHLIGCYLKALIANRQGDRKGIARSYQLNNIFLEFLLNNDASKVLLKIEPDSMKVNAFF